MLEIIVWIVTVSIWVTLIVGLWHLSRFVTLKDGPEE